MHSIFRHEAFKVFLKANAWVITTMIGLLSIDTTSVLIKYNAWTTFALIISIELLIIYFCHITSDQVNFFSNKDVFSEKLNLEYAEVRFASLQDGSGTEEVYDQWFTNDVAMSDEEYDKIVARSGFVRSLEITIRSGSYIEKKIAGYYSVFALSDDIFLKLSNGTLKEKDLRDCDVLDFSNEISTVLYITEICVLKDIDVGHILLRDMLRYIRYIVNGNKNIQKISAWPYTKYGKRLARAYKMKPAPGRRFFQKVHYVDSALLRAHPLPSGKFKDQYRITF